VALVNLVLTRQSTFGCIAAAVAVRNPYRERVLIDNLLVRIHNIIVMIRWTGLAPWEFEPYC